MPKENQSDHDILIELRTIVQSLKEDIKAFADVTQKQLQDHESRIRGIEERNIKFDASSLVPKYDKMWEEWETLKSNWKLLSIIAGIIFTIVASVLARGLNKVLGF